MQTNDLPRPWNRACGLAGVAGALLFFVGDMLLYGRWGPGADFRNGMLDTVRQASLTRLFTGGLIGLPAAWLGLLGCWHVRQNVAVRSPRAGWVVFYAMAAMMAALGAVHLLWVSRGLAIRFTGQAGNSAPDLVASLRDYWTAADDCARTPGYLAAVLLLGLVPLGQTLYPRWTALINPGVLLLVVEPLMRYCPAPLGAGLVGGFSSLALVLFFLVSVVSTWKRGDTLLRPFEVSQAALTAAAPV